MRTEADEANSPSRHCVDAAMFRAARARCASGCRTPCPSWCWRPASPLILVFVYGFILWTVYLSFTNAKAIPIFDARRLRHLSEAMALDLRDRPPSNWYTAIVNMGIFAGLYIVFCLALGLTLAILLDQKMRGEGFLRPIYLYPLALSFIVTGTAWKLFLDPGIGLEKAVHDWGWTSFKFDWIVNPRMMIYCVVIAGVWQSLGLRHGDVPGRSARHRRRDIKAAQIDGASDFASTGASSSRSCARSSFRPDRAGPSGDQVLRSGAVA